ncbi:MAG: EamA family transporter [Eubacteriales bacterium]
MNWFFFALLTMLAWGAADLFYKKGADEEDRYSHLKTSVMVGVVMGIHALFMLIKSGFDYDFMNLVIYLPVSLMYILSMTIGYFGLRYLELSISSPIQNTSGALVCIMCLVFLGQRMDVISAVAVVVICVGVFLLGLLEKKKEDEYEAENNKKYKIGFVAFLMPILYCVFDSLGTFFDAYYLDDIESTPLRGVTEANFEDTANISYELTFLIVAILLFVYVRVIKKQKFGLLAQRDRACAAVLETAGQAAYVYAMSGKGVIAAPMIAAYSIVSIVLSRIFLKEKLSGKQYAVVAAIMVGIVLLGVAEGLAE